MCAMRFEDRVVVVTGGGGPGLGSAIAQGFADEGARVAVLDRNAERAASVARRIGDAGGQAMAVTIDVRSAEHVTAAVQHVLQAWQTVDVLVNSAFTACPDGILDADPADWARDVDVILKGTFHCVRSVLPAMVRQHRGAIVSISSVNAHTYVGASAYSAAKAGVESLSRSIAVEFANRGIRSNVVVPGTFATDSWAERVAQHPDIFARLAQWYPAGRIGQIGEIAAAVWFLASDQASWITGAAVPVDGGLLAGNAQFAREVHPGGPTAEPDPGTRRPDA